MAFAILICMPPKTNGTAPFFRRYQAHEIVGRVTAVGGHVTKFKVSDYAGVGYERVFKLASFGYNNAVGWRSAPSAASCCFRSYFKTPQAGCSLIGGIEETQQMLDFCAEKNIMSDVEVIPIDYINTAYERILKSDVKYRFVIDMATL